LFSLNEDIKINFNPISDLDINDIVESYKKQIIKYDLSPFEVETFIALTYFSRSNCDIAVIECGMGGLIDATNVFDPILAIITTVSLEHTSFLGRTLYEITSNKLGICRENGKLLTGILPDESMEVIKEFCIENKVSASIISDVYSPRIIDGGIEFDYSNLRNVRIKSNARYSVTNACIAIDAVKLLSESYPISEENIRAGLEYVSMPVRFQIISKDPLVIIDGAHNPEAMQKLSESLPNICEGKKINTVFACFKDKNLLGLLNIAGAFSSTLTLTTFDHPRARDMMDYFLFGDEYKFEDDFVKLINDTIENNKDDATLITGSLAFASVVYEAYEQGKIKIPTK